MRKQHTAMTFASIGDCVIDRYTKEHKSYLGGTAFNSALVCAKLGAKVQLFSAVGSDNAGKSYLDACQSNGINCSFLEQKQGKTSTILIDTSDMTNPQYIDWKLEAMDDYLLSKQAIQNLQSMDCAKIALFTPMIKLFEQFISLHLPHTKKVVDFSGVSLYTDTVLANARYFNGCDVIIKSTTKDDKNTLSLLQDIAKQKQKVCLVLLGKDGSVVFDREKNFTVPSLLANVIDTNGAGDAYIGTFCYWWYVSGSIPFAMEQATKKAAEIVSLPGGSGMLVTS